MKNFFKKHIFLIICIVIDIIFFALASVSIVFLMIASIFTGCIILSFARKSRLKLKDLSDYSYEDDYFDASKLDYDEDVYFIGNPKKQKKEIKKNIFSKLSVSAPTVGLYFLGIGFIVIAVFTAISSLF